MIHEHGYVQKPVSTLVSRLSFLLPQRSYNTSQQKQVSALTSRLQNVDKSFQSVDRLVTNEIDNCTHLFQKVQAEGQYSITKRNERRIDYKIRESNVKTNNASVIHIISVQTKGRQAKLNLKYQNP